MKATWERDESVCADRELKNQYRKSLLTCADLVQTNMVCTAEQQKVICLAVMWYIEYFNKMTLWWDINICCQHLAAGATGSNCTWSSLYAVSFLHWSLSSAMLLFKMSDVNLMSSWRLRYFLDNDFPAVKLQLTAIKPDSHWWKSRECPPHGKALVLQVPKKLVCQPIYC